MALDHFNFEAAFEKLGGRMDVLNEKFNSMDTKIDNSQKLLKAELVPLHEDIEMLKQEVQHCDKSRKTMNDAFAKAIKDLDAKIAIDPMKAQQLEARNADALKRIDQLERVQVETKARQDTIAGTVKGAWAAVFAIFVSMIAGGGLLFVHH